MQVVIGSVKKGEGPAQRGRGRPRSKSSVREAWPGSVSQAASVPLNVLWGRIQGWIGAARQLWIVRQSVSLEAPCSSLQVQAGTATTRPRCTCCVLRTLYKPCLGATHQQALPQRPKGHGPIAASALNTTKSETLSPWLGAVCPVAALLGHLQTFPSTSLGYLKYYALSVTSQVGIACQPTRVACWPGPGLPIGRRRVPRFQKTTPPPLVLSSVCFLAAPFLSIETADKFATLELGQVDPRTSVTRRKGLIVRALGNLANLQSACSTACIRCQMLSQSWFVLSV